MRVRGRDHVGPGEVHLRVDAEGSTVHWLVALDHVALVIDQDQVRDLDLAEVHSERIDPEPVMMLGVARREVAVDTLGAPQSPEATKRPGGLLLAADAFQSAGVARGSPRPRSISLVGHSHFVVSRLL